METITPNPKPVETIRGKCQKHFQHSYGSETMGLYIGKSLAVYFGISLNQRPLLGPQNSVAPFSKRAVKDTHRHPIT